MTEAENKVKAYFKKWMPEQYIKEEDAEFKALVRILKSEQRKTHIDGIVKGIKETLEEVEKSLMSDEEMSYTIEEYIDKHGYKGHDLSMCNDYLTHSQVENMVNIQRNKTQELINKLKTK